MPVPRLGQTIRNVREARKLTLENVALQVNISHQQLSRIERNQRHPTLLTLHRLDCVLRLPDEVLLGFIRQACCGPGGEAHA
jgi:transcriptional regulator with XRE-family HTH domain